MTTRGYLLLVGGDAIFRAALAEALTREGYRVLCAAASGEIFPNCSIEQIDAVLLDLNLGDENGWDVFYALKALRPELPIIVTSAHDDRLTHPSARRASAVLEKPFDLADLLALVEQAT